MGGLGGKSVSVDEGLVDVLAIIQQELNEANFKWLTDWSELWLDVFSVLVIISFFVSDFNPDVSVRNDAFHDDLLDFLRDIKFFDEEILAVVIIILCSLTTIANHSILSANVVFLNSQFSFGQGSSLADADVVKHCASLDTFDILDEDLILFEAFNRHCHCNRNCEWETFWDRYNKKNNSNNDYFRYFQKSPTREESLISEQTHNNEVDQMSNNTDCHGSSGIFPDLFRDAFKFPLKLSLLF